MLSLVRRALPDHQSARWAAPSTVEPCSHPTGLAAAPASISILPLPTTITRLRSGRLRRAVSTSYSGRSCDHGSGDRYCCRHPERWRDGRGADTAGGGQSRTIRPRRAVIRRGLPAVGLPVYSADRGQLVATALAPVTTALAPVATVLAPVTRRWPRLRPDFGATGDASRPRSADVAGAHFARLTVLPALMILAWLIPGLPLLLGNYFLPVPMLLISVPLIVALSVNGLRVVPASWPRLLSADRTAEPGWTVWFGLLATVAIVAGLTGWQLTERSEALIVLRDPGAYLQAGYWLAQHGSLPIPEAIKAFGGAHAGLNFASSGFLARGASLYPAAMPGLPLLLAGAFWVHGISAATVAGPVLGGLAALAFAGLGGSAGRASVGSGRGTRPRADIAAAVHWPDLAERDGVADHAVRRALPAGRLAGVARSAGRPDAGRPPAGPSDPGGQPDAAPDADAPRPSRDGCATQPDRCGDPVRGHGRGRAAPAWPGRAGPVADAAALASGARRSVARVRAADQPRRDHLPDSGNSLWLRAGDGTPAPGGARSWSEVLSVFSMACSAATCWTGRSSTRSARPSRWRALSRSG